jgi:hypothetical protein
MSAVLRINRQFCSFAELSFCWRASSLSGQEARLFFGEWPSERASLDFLFQAHLCQWRRR